MTLLFRYLFKMFAKNLLLVLASFAGIYLLIDFFERIDNFLEKNLPFSMAAKYFLCKLPLIGEQLLPVSIMLAGIVTVGLLHHNRELLSLQAAGIGMPRIVRPVFLAALFFTLLGLASSQWLMPATQSAVNRIWYQDVNNLFPTGILRGSVIYYRGREGFYIMGLPRPGEPGLYSPFSYIRSDASFEFLQQFSAREAKWQDGKWQLVDGTIKNQSPEGLRVESFRQKAVILPEGPKELLVPPYREQELSLGSLLERMHSDNLPESRNAALKFHEKVSYLFLGLPLLLIGLATLLLIFRTRKRDLSIAIPISCLIAFLTWGGWGVVQSLARANYFAPPATWLVHFFIGGTGLFLLRQQSK